MGPLTKAAPLSPTPSPMPDELVSEAELGLAWLQHRAEMVRLELQAIELELALQQARQGDQETLQIWLRKHGTPWNNPAPNGESSYLANHSILPNAVVQLGQSPQQHEPSQNVAIPETARSTEKILRINLPATEPTASKPAFPSKPIETNTLPKTEVSPIQQNDLLEPVNSDESKQPTATSPSTASTTSAAPPKPATKTSELKPRSKSSPNQSSPEQKKHSAKPLPSVNPKQPPSSQIALRKETKLPAQAEPQSETPTVAATAKKMPPWLISAAAHAALLVLLMIFTLPLPEKRETLGLSGTFKPETTPQLQITETTQNMTSEVENQVLEDVKLASPPMENVLSNSLPSASDIAASINASPDLGSLATPSDAVGQSGSGMSGQLGDALNSSQMMAANFFGLEATGSVFCFVVDCSGSMRGEPFVTAKRELLRSISQLKPNQRFFVVFFSQKLFPMQLDGPEMPDSHPTAVYATPENLSKLQQWMETVPIGAGGPPNEALKLAIELESDSVFLLTDGVTRSDVASYLQRTNRQEDELDGPQIRCPIHTIGFYSREGEALLQRIASENRGQYHYVPDPQPNKKK